MNSQSVLLLPCTFALIACTAVGPDYQRPSIDLPDRFVEEETVSNGETTTRQWWQDLNDTGLNTLVSRGLAQNLDIRTALERIKQAEAALGATGRASQIGGDVSVTATRADDGTSVSTTGSGALNASLVLDLFGGIRRAREQVQAQYEGAQYDVGTTQLAFLSGLVGNYLDARYYQEAIALTRQSLESRRQTLALVERQRFLGIATDLDIANAEALLNEAQADLPSLETGFYGAVYGIATLLAEPAEPLVAAMQEGAAQPWPQGGSTAGIPADVLRNRPDIISVERDLAAATAAIGVAEAELYPSLDLDGTIISSSTSSWSFGPTLSLPVLNQLVLRASRDQQISLARQVELTWRSTVLQAVEDVQTAQTNYLRMRREVTARQASSASYARVLELSNSAYEAGTTTLLDLLDAERSRTDAQLSLAGSVRGMADAWVTLQIASGLGWAT